MFHFLQSSRKPSRRCPPDINIALIVIKFLHKGPHTLINALQFRPFESPSSTFRLRVPQGQIGDVDCDLMQRPFEKRVAHILEISTSSDGRVVESHKAVGYQLFDSAGMYNWGAGDCHGQPHIGSGDIAGDRAAERPWIWYTAEAKIRSRTAVDTPDCEVGYLPSCERLRGIGRGWRCCCWYGYTGHQTQKI